MLRARASPGSTAARLSRCAPSPGARSSIRPTLTTLALTPSPFQVCTSPGARHANGTHAWSLTTLAPLLLGGWALLGEPDKFVGVSGRRFSRVDGTSAARMSLEIEGAAGEQLRLVAVSPPPHATVLVLHTVLPAAGRAECHVMASAEGNGTLVCRKPVSLPQ
jgi:hypothetical protein